MKLLTVLAVSSLCLMAPVPTHAATMVTYDFSGYQIPAGQPTTLTVDDSTIAMMKTNPAYIIGFVDALAARYNNCNAVINKTYEVTYLTCLANGTAVGGTHIPAYTTAASSTMVDNTTPQITTPKVQDNTANKDYPKATKIDVNVTTQTLTVYSGDTATIITPVVTGNISKGNGTPIGDFSVLFKQRGRTLVGKNNSYRSYTNVCLRLNTKAAIYLHDATWRSSFGGEIYKRNGSHGCINIPLEAAKNIYNCTPEGTPVSVHY